MQQAGTFLHSDLGQLLHQPQCFLEEKKLLKCLMWMMRARCSAGSDGSSAPVSFVQGYRHSNAVTHWQGRLSSQKCFSDEIYGLTAQSQALSMSHIHPAAIRGHQQFIFLMTSRLRLKSSPYNQCCDSGTVTQV